MPYSIVVHDNNTNLNSWLTIRPLSRLYCSYDNNTNETTAAQNVWGVFPNSSTPLTIYRIQDFEITGSNKFTYTGPDARWFNISVVCNVHKGSGNPLTPDRKLEFQWALNGTRIGNPRSCELDSQITSIIISGNGEIYMSQNDYIEPMIRTIANDGKVILENCSFNITESPENVWTV